MAKDEREVINLKEKKKIAFVGSGGAVKALAFHMGVLMALEEHDITIRGAGGKYEIVDIVGSSAGSIFGAFVSNNFSLDRIMAFLRDKPLWQYFINFTPREKGKMYGLSYKDILPPNIPTPGEIAEALNDRLKWDRYKNAINDIKALANNVLPEFLRTGDADTTLDRALRSANVDYMGIEGVVREFVQISALSNTDLIEKYLADILEINDFIQLRRERGIDLYVVGTELNRPRKAIFGPQRSEFTADPWEDRYVDSVPISTACAASSSLPVLYRPKKIIIEGEKLYFVDGEVKKTLSTHIARENGADLIIVSHTLEPYKYDHTKRSLTRHGLVSILLQSIFIGVAQKIRASWDIHKLRHQIYDHISTREFQKELDRILREANTGDSKKAGKAITEFLQQTVSELLNIDKEMQYIYIPSDNTVFWMDHFNIFPHYMKRLANAGYNCARKAIDENYRIIK